MAIVMTLVATLVVAVAAAPAGHPATFDAWLASVIAVLGFRAWNVWRFPRDPVLRLDASPAFLVRFAAGIVLTGLCWAAFVLLFYRDLPSHEQTLVSTVVTAFATGGMTVLASLPWLAMTYTMLMLVPMAVALFAGDTRADLMLGALSLIYVVLSFGTVRMASGSIREAIRLARENANLFVEAVDREARMRTLNTELEHSRQAQIAANERLEHTVRRRTMLLEKEIEERKSYQERLERLANEDPLTALANRSRLNAVLNAAAPAQADSGQSRFVVYFIDLDRFKELNDGLGHATGDRVLRVLAQRMRAVAARALCVARWGGDEFVIVRRPDDDDDEAADLAWGDRLIAALSAPIELDHGPVQIGATIGVARHPADGTNPEQIVRLADMAVFHAKQQGGGVTCAYRAEWGALAEERHELMQALRRAIDTDALELHYQPIVDLADGRVHAFEALVRWRHPTLGNIPPARFVALAEESGHIVRLGAWVLRRACREARRFVGDRCERVAVNVSVRQFSQGDFLAVLDEALADSGLDPRALEIELTESVFAEDTDQVLATLRAIRRRGVRISIDDFGAGYSSLSYLQRFPVHTLKVDRSFVRDLDNGGETIISAVLSMSRSLGLEVVVEGVETEAIRARIRALGALCAQGYLFARPMPPREIDGWLAAHASSVATNPSAAPVLGDA